MSRQERAAILPQHALPEKPCARLQKKEASPAALDRRVSLRYSCALQNNGDRPETKSRPTTRTATGSGICDVLSGRHVSTARGGTGVLACPAFGFRRHSSGQARVEARRSQSFQRRRKIHRRNPCLHGRIPAPARRQRHDQLGEDFSAGRHHRAHCRRPPGDHLQARASGQEYWRRSRETRIAARNFRRRSD